MNKDVLSSLDVTTPNSARMYDYLLGGKDNFAADREAGEQILRAFPEARDGVRHSRQFLSNIVRHLASEVGIRQFIDIGAGLPTQNNVHQIVHSVAPDARTVYVDYDPVVCVHGRALLAKSPMVAMVNADVRKPEDLKEKVSQTGLIDWEQPVGILLIAVLHLVEEADEHVAKLRDMLPAGSHLALSQVTLSDERRNDTERMREIYAHTNRDLVPRTVEEIRQLFGDFELLNNSLFIPSYLQKRFLMLGWGAVGRKP